MATSSRKTALTALSEVTENEGYSNIVIDKAIRAAELSPRDAALASTIFYGVLEKRLTLDFYIRKFLAKPKQKLDGTVLNILRIAVYQMMYLDRVPDSAAVNEAVLCAAEYRRGQYKNFVNGVLRSFARGWHEVIIPEDDLSVRYNIPQPIIESFKKDYGETVCIDLLKAMSERAETYIRINPLKTEGKFHVQDLSSQLLCAFVSPQPGERLADVCAAPGGKSFTLSEYMENTGVLDAFDLYKGRVNLIKKGAERLGLSIIHAAVRDAATGVCEKQYDRVLCDVPCSGLGVIRRKPEIRYKKQESFKELPALQLKILEHSAQLVRPGGILFYSTCTLRNAENGAVVTEFLKCHPEFEPYDLPETEGISHTVNEPKFMRTMMPMDHGGDGFFAAAMRRKTETGKETKR